MIRALVKVENAKVSTYVHIDILGLRFFSLSTSIRQNYYNITNIILLVDRNKQDKKQMLKSKPVLVVRNNFSYPHTHGNND